MMNVESVESLATRMSEGRSDPWASIPWHLEVDESQSCWELAGLTTFGASSWYGAATAPERRRLALLEIVHFLETGVSFERVLSMALLRRLEDPRTTPAERRLTYEEVIDEANHSLMFSRFIQSAGVGVPHGPVDSPPATEILLRAAIESPPTFFLSTLAGEVPVDWLQREILASSSDIVHPVLREICAVHSREEARHIAYAIGALNSELERSSQKDRRRFLLGAPRLVAGMTCRMLLPSAAVVLAASVPAGAVTDPATVEESKRRVRGGSRRLMALLGRQSAQFDLARSPSYVASCHEVLDSTVASHLRGLVDSIESGTAGERSDRD